MAQLMPLPLTVSCFSKIQIGSTFLVPAYLGSRGQRAVDGCLFVVFVGLDQCLELHCVDAAVCDSQACATYPQIRYDTIPDQMEKENQVPGKQPLK